MLKVILKKKMFASKSKFKRILLVLRKLFENKNTLHIQSQLFLDLSGLIAFDAQP